MSSPEHRRAVEAFRDILEQNIDGEVYSNIHLEKDYPREFDFDDSEAINSDVDILVENGVIAHIYEMKTGITSICKGFRQVRDAERYFQDKGFETVSDILITDPAYRDARKAIEELDWYFRIDDFKERVEDHKYSYCHLRSADLIKDLSELRDEINRDISRKYPRFDYEQLEKLDLVERNGDGYETTSKYRKLLRRMSEDDEIYHMTPKDNLVRYWPLEETGDELPAVKSY